MLTNDEIKYLFERKKDNYGWGAMLGAVNNLSITNVLDFETVLKDTIKNYKFVEDELQRYSKEVLEKNNLEIKEGAKTVIPKFPEKVTDFKPVSHTDNIERAKEVSVNKPKVIAKF